MRFQFKQSYNADINLFRDSLAVRDYLIVLAVFMLAPMVMLSSGGGSTLLDFGTTILIFSIAGLGMMILTGFTGVVSLGHAAFMLLGAYLYHYLLNLVGADTFGLWAIISGLITAIIVAGIGYLVARPALRMTGIFLSIASLLFFELVNGMLTNVGGFAVDKLVVSDTWVHTFWLGVMDLLRVEISLFERVVWWNPLSWLQGLYNALIQFDVVIAGRAEAPQLRVAAHGLHLYYVSLVLLIVGIWITRNITRSPLGRGLVAIRDSEVSARCMGIDAKHGKCLAMAISAGFTAIAGILFAYSIDGEFQAGKVGDGSITLVESIVLLLIVVVGGLGSIHGAILGAIAYRPALHPVRIHHQLRRHRPRPARRHAVYRRLPVGEEDLRCRRLRRSDPAVLRRGRGLPRRGRGAGRYSLWPAADRDPVLRAAGPVRPLPQVVGLLRLLPLLPAQHLPSPARLFQDRPVALRRGGDS